MMICLSSQESNVSPLSAGRLNPITGKWLKVKRTGKCVKKQECLKIHSNQNRLGNQRLKKGRNWFCGLKATPCWAAALGSGFPLFDLLVIPFRYKLHKLEKD